MNEREEFQLPANLGRILAEPVPIAIPSARMMAQRAIAFGVPNVLTAMEIKVYTFAAALFALAIAKMVAEWWWSVRFELTIPVSEVALLLQQFGAVLGRVHWSFFLVGITIGLAITTVSQVKRSL
ncbi:MAG: hypothetical protein OEM52_03265 [bacterium]|nr:hypothetical protein [bacterium]